MLIAVGGHARKIGKTSLVCGIIRKLRSRHWTAVKITQYGAGSCVRDGSACECGPQQDHPFELSEEYEPTDTDSGRYLAAGAERSFWLRCSAGRLFEAAALVRKLVDQSENIIIESTSIVDYFDPDVFLMLVDFACEDMKPNSLQFMDRADAFVIVDRGINLPMWEGVASEIWAGKPQLTVKPPAYVSAAVADFVKLRMSAAGTSGVR
jgi:hypothetical protein